MPLIISVKSGTGAHIPKALRPACAWSCVPGRVGLPITLLTYAPPRHKIQTQRNQTSKRLKTHIPRLSLCAQPLRTYTISPVTTHLESLDIGGFYGHPETRKARLTDGLSWHLCELCSRT